jgi:hypothetical protein
MAKTVAITREEIEDTVSQKLTEFESVIARELKETFAKFDEKLEAITKPAVVTPAVVTSEVPLITPAPVEAAVAAPAVTLPSPLPTLNVLKTIKATFISWYPWLKFTFWVIVGLLIWQFFVFPFLTGQPIGIRTGLSRITKITVDVNTPEGAATVEMQNEPFRSDTTSRQTFGRIFSELDNLVATGQIVNLEGYYDAFGKKMQDSIPADKYVQWAPIWNRLASVSYRHGNVGSDVKAFNANLQAAAAVISGKTKNYSEPETLPQLPPPPISGNWQYTPIP